MLKRDAYEGSPAAMKVLGVPLITAAAVVASVTLIWVIYRAFVDFGLRVNTAFSIYVPARGHRSGRRLVCRGAPLPADSLGVDVAARYKEIPVE